MSAPLRAAVIGLGRMGSTFDDERTSGGAVYLPYCHTPAYLASPHTELVAGADPHDEQRSIYAERWGLEGHVYADYRELLDKEKPDIVSVCTSARPRAEIVETAANSGVTAIWAEKPVALTLAQADRMVEVCAANGVTLAVNCARRWNPHYASARELIMAGEIGEVLQVTAYYLCGLSHNGSHGIDAMRFLAADGNVRWVFGEIESDEAAFGEEDPQGNGYLAFDNGVRGFLRSIECGPVTGREFDVLGTGGRIRVVESNLQFELWKPVPGGPREARRRRSCPSLTRRGSRGWGRPSSTTSSGRPRPGASPAAQGRTRATPSRSPWRCGSRTAAGSSGSTCRWRTAPSASYRRKRWRTTCRRGFGGCRRGGELVVVELTGIAGSGTVRGAYGSRTGPAPFSRIRTTRISARDSFSGSGFSPFFPATSETLSRAINFSAPSKASVSPP